MIRRLGFVGVGLVLSFLLLIGCGQQSGPGAGQVLTAISIAPSSSSVALGNQTQFTATGTFRDGRVQDVSSSVTWSSSSMTVAIVSDSGLATGEKVGTTTITATSGSASASASIKVTTPTGSVPATYFGMQKAGFSDPWYTVPVAASRLFAYEGTLWGRTETADGVYDWTVLDKAVDEAVPHGVDLAFAFGMVPTWLSSNPTDATCNSDQGAGTCDPPSDLCTDAGCTNALGTDQHFKDFITNLMNHVTAGGNKVSDVVRYYETWAEFNIPAQWVGTDAQMLRMQQDLYATVKSINPNDLVLTPSTTGNDLGDQLVSYLTQQGPPYPALSVTDVVAFHGYCNNGLTPAAVVPECIVAPLQALNGGLVGTGFDLLPLWNTESSWGSVLASTFTDGDERAAFAVRSLLLMWANGVKRFYWWAWDQPASGRLWNATSQGECTAPISQGGFLCTTGMAYSTVHDWMQGHTMTQPCFPSGNVWSCGMDNGLIVWDASQTCSPCTFANYTPPTAYKHSTDVYGMVTDLSGTTVQIGYRPVLLTQ